MPISQSGCVHICSFDRSVIPKMTSGGMMIADAKYPSQSGIPSPTSRPWAMMDPSSAKKMKVKLA
jgi:hypothetical protein